MTTILSIQSSVAYGHVGNSAATFPLMRMGVEVWPVLTVHFSNHTGYPGWRGPLLRAEDVADVIRGIDERGVLDRCDAVLSGYQGGADVGAVILDAVALVRSRNPSALYCCDPVLGDVGRGVYVRPGIPELMRDRVVPAAQVITPNQFELELLTGLGTTTLPEVLAAAQAARALGPEIVLVTSVVHTDAEPGTIDMVAVSGEGAWRVTTPLLPRTFTGAGDLTAATFLATYLRTRDVAASVAHTAAVVHGVLDVTVRSGQAELQLVAAQDEIAAPTRTFQAVPV
ncbi:pyridoxal kinase PdxY [Microlunatus capsulatus]|uniref:pyridoxal kinase n=1 Tax=Microlunatus capsulatus TaxID=99117 RepID=A0ABS4Z4V0_9ACTN|nr:pyridoxal kinase PdxY [Microlunatus capsulatus]MBP2415273.1 pyridoxine kinase [Microlunatus capsulatus]